MRQLYRPLDEPPVVRWGLGGIPDTSFRVTSTAWARSSIDGRTSVPFRQRISLRHHVHLASAKGSHSFTLIFTLIYTHLHSFTLMYTHYSFSFSFSFSHSFSLSVKMSEKMKMSENMDRRNLLEFENRNGKTLPISPHSFSVSPCSYYFDHFYCTSPDSIHTIDIPPRMEVAQPLFVCHPL